MWQLGQVKNPGCIMRDCLIEANTWIGALDYTGFESNDAINDKRN
jgi:hypothetical protein